MLDGHSLNRYFNSREHQIKYQYALCLTQHKLRTLSKIKRSLDFRARLRAVAAWKSLIFSPVLKAPSVLGGLFERLKQFSSLLEGLRKHKERDGFSMILRYLTHKKIQTSLKLTEDSVASSQQQEVQDIQNEILSLRGKYRELERDSVNMKQQENEYADKIQHIKTHKMKKKNKESEADIQEDIRMYTEENNKLQEKLHLIEANIEDFMGEMNTLIEMQGTSEVPSKRKPKKKASRSKVSVISADLFK